MLDTERTDRIILLKLLEDKDNLIRQLQTQLSQQNTPSKMEKNPNIAHKNTHQTTMHLTDEDLSDDFSKVENEIILLLNQNKKLKHKANKTIKHRKPDEQNPSNLSVNEDYAALRQMIDIQEEIELRLTGEVSGLRGTVQQQDALLREWEPIINQFKIANSTYQPDNVSRSRDKGGDRQQNRHFHRSSSNEHYNGEQKDQPDKERRHKAEHSHSHSVHSTHHRHTSHSDHLNHLNHHSSSHGYKDAEDHSAPSTPPRQDTSLSSVSPIPTHSPSSTSSSTTSFSNRSASSSSSPHGSAGRFSSDAIRHDLDRLLDEIGHATTTVPNGGNSNRNVSVSDVNRQSPLVSPMGYHK